MAERERRHEKDSFCFHDKIASWSRVNCCPGISAMGKIDPSLISISHTSCLRTFSLALANQNLICYSALCWWLVVAAIRLGEKPKCWWSVLKIGHGSHFDPSRLWPRNSWETIPWLRPESWSRSSWGYATSREALLQPTSSRCSLSISKSVQQVSGDSLFSKRQNIWPSISSRKCFTKFSRRRAKRWVRRLCYYFETSYLVSLHWSSD